MQPRCAEKVYKRNLHQVKQLCAEIGFETLALKELKSV